MHDTTLCWYLVRTKSKQDARVAANLRSWGIETLAPVVRDGRDSHTKAHRQEPLFPGYVFARFKLAPLLGKVRLTRGVHSVVGFGECATVVDDAVVDMLKSHLDEDGCAQARAPIAGDRVRVMEGPLRSLEGIFERQSANERVVILLALLGAHARVEIARSAIQSTGTAPMWDV